MWTACISKHICLMGYDRGQPGNLEEASPLTFGAQQQGPCQGAEAEMVQEMWSSLYKLQSHGV